jgi:hypothetical protein
MNSSEGCSSCVNLYDGKYCIKWRDVVPEEVQKYGCEEIDQYPPF